MNKDNISALIMAIAVVALIAGFAVYFNSPGLNKASTSAQQQQVEKFVSAATIQNGSLATIKLDKDQFQQIDKSQFRSLHSLASLSSIVLLLSYISISYAYIYIYIQTNILPSQLINLFRMTYRQ
jgi:hypothetical protein